MKITTKASLLFLLLATLGLVLWRSHLVDEGPVVVPQPSPSTALPQPPGSTPATTTKASSNPPARDIEARGVEANAGDQIVATEEVISQARLSSPASLAAAVVRLKQRDQKAVAETLGALLAGSENNGALRDKLIWLARRINGPTMLPFWQDVLTRTPPRSSGEDLTRDRYPEEAAAHASSERIDAVAAVSEIPGRDGTRILTDIVNQSGEYPAVPTVLRFEAARQLQLRDSKTLTRLSRILKADDPLRAQLSSWAAVKRGEH